MPKTAREDEKPRACMRGVWSVFLVRKEAADGGERALGVRWRGRKAREVVADRGGEVGKRKEKKRERRERGRDTRKGEEKKEKRIGPV